jgi:hypothetical protein
MQPKKIKKKRQRGEREKKSEQIPSFSPLSLSLPLSHLLLLMIFNLLQQQQQQNNLAKFQSQVVHS